MVITLWRELPESIRYAHYDVYCKLENSRPRTPLLKPRPHQQQCRSNVVECYNIECCFDNVAVFGNNVEATFDFVAKNGNNVERVLRWNFILSTKSNVASTLLPKTATLSKQHATISLNILKTVQQSCLLLRQCCFDIVASVDRALDYIV